MGEKEHSNWQDIQKANIRWQRSKFIYMNNYIECKWLNIPIKRPKGCQMGFQKLHLTYKRQKKYLDTEGYSKFEQYD